jgi:hypothetical protein
LFDERRLVFGVWILWVLRGTEASFIKEFDVVVSVCCCWMVGRLRFEVFEQDRRKEMRYSMMREI